MTKTDGLQKINLRHIRFLRKDHSFSKSMRCIVVDDEKPGRDLICSYVEKVPFLELVGAYANTADALNFLMNNTIDVAFLDIELNGSINGMQLIATLPNRPLVIFITAYEHYAVDSYALDAVDYLLKPVSPDRFFRAANKAYQQWMQGRSAAAPGPTPTVAPQSGPSSVADYLFVKTENRLIKVYLHDILFIEGYGDYIKIHLADQRMILSLQSLNAMESRLPSNFIRTHRSYIVAIDKIDEIERRRIRIGKAIIPISNSYQDKFLEKVQDQSNL